MGLSDEDKEWLASQLGGQIGALKVMLDGFEGRFDGFEGRFDGFERRFDDFERRFKELERRFEEKLERVETNLLTEFHKWASPMELRVKSHATAMRALDMELEDVKDRLKKLEPPETSH